jgi:hypothetical protein
LICLDHRQGVTLHQYSIDKNVDGLLNTLKFVYKIPEDVIEFVVEVQNVL